MSTPSSPSNRDERIEKIENDIVLLKSDVSEIKGLLRELLLANKLKEIEKEKPTDEPIIMSADTPIDTFAAADDDFVPRFSRGNQNKNEAKPENKKDKYYQSARRSTILGPSLPNSADEPINPAAKAGFLTMEPDHSHLVLSSLKIQDICIFYQKFHEFTSTHKYCPSLLGKLTEKVKKLLASKIPNLTVFEINTKTNEEILDLISEAIRPKSRNNFLLLLDSNVNFKMPYDGYKPTATDFSLFVQALYTYREDFATVFDLLAHKNTQSNIPPINNKDNLGVIKLFNKKIPNEYGIRTFSNMFEEKSKEYETLEQYLNDFYKVVASDSRHGEHSRDLQMKLSARLESKITSMATKHIYNEPYATRLRNKPSTQRLHMVNDRPVTDNDFFDNNEITNDSVGDYLLESERSEFQEQSVAIKDMDCNVYEEDGDDLDVLFKYQDNLNYIYADKKQSFTVPPSQTNYQKLLQRPKGKEEVNQYNLLKNLPCRKHLWNQCQHAAKPEDCKFSHDPKELVKLWNQIQELQKTSKFKGALSHDDA